MNVVNRITEVARFNRIFWNIFYAFNETVAKVGYR
jgi:hypothetical protein